MFVPLSLSLLAQALCWLLQCGDVQPNPGPTNSGHKVMVSCAEKFVECLTRDPSNIALSWFSKGLISRTILEKTNELNEINGKKASRLYIEVVKLVEQNPDKYESIIESFKGQELFSDLKQLLDNKYEEEESMDVAPSPLSLDTTDNVDERSGVVRSDSLATTSDCSSPPTSPMSLSSGSSPSSSLTGFVKERRNERVNALCRNNLMTVKRNFATFVSTIKKEFAKTTVDIEAVKEELVLFNADVSGLDDMASIIACFIKRHEWDYWNCDHLCAIVNTYGNKKMQKAEADYREQFDHFSRTTYLTDYLALNPDKLSRKIKQGSSKNYWQGKRRSSSEYRDRLSFKVDVDISRHTLSYIEDLWKRTRHRGLPKVGVVLDNVCEGSLEVHWIILHPNITLEFRKKALLPEAVVFYKENKIIRVILNEECLYSADIDSSISSDVFKLPASDSIEEEPEEDSSDLTDNKSLTNQGDLETVPPVTGQEKIDTETSEEPVKLKPLAKEKRNLSELFGKFTKPFRKSVSEKLLAECRKKKANIEAVKGYLKHTDCDVNIREDDELSPLMLACKNKHFEIAKLILKYRPHVNIQDKRGWTPLIMACQAGNLEVVRGIVELGAEIDKPTKALCTPLFWVAHYGNVEVARFLLEKGAFVDYADENGWTPLMQASQEGHVDIVNLLLEYNAKMEYQTETSWCALMAAAKNKRSEVVEALLKGGAQVDIERKDGTTTLQVASYYKGNSDILKTLTKYDAKINHLNKDGMSALMMATNRGHLELVIDLLDRGADIDQQHPATRWTAIFFAAKSGNMAIFKELLHRGAKTEIEGRNVVDVASMFRRGKMVSELKGFEQESHKKSMQMSSSVHPPSLEPAEPLSINQTKEENTPETPSTEQIIQPVLTTPQSSELGPASSLEITDEEKDLTQSHEEELARESPQLPDTGGIEKKKPQIAGTPSTTFETEEREVPIASTDPLPAVEADDPTPAAQDEPKNTSEMNLKNTKKSEEKSITKNIDIKLEAEIIDRLLKSMSNRMANERSSNQSRRKGIPRVEDFTHQEMSPEVTDTLNITTPSSLRTIAVSEDPYDDLYS